jgi:hypothetical protein
MDQPGRAVGGEETATVLAASGSGVRASPTTSRTSGTAGTASVDGGFGMGSLYLGVAWGK